MTVMPRGRARLNKSEVPVFVLIAAGVVFAAGAGVYLTTSSSQPDLRPIEQREGRSQVLSWSSLVRRHSLTIGAPDQAHGGMEVSALGYAMDDPGRPVGDGDRVTKFVLMPDSGNLFHLAHRFGDQMIEVCLRQKEAFEFRAGEMVWVHGTLRILPGDPLGQVPLYKLEQAHVQPARKTAIARFFQKLSWSGGLD
ncbi:MAG TPA: hypothetical protein VMI94_25890 [Bryobacteraceae bacterium]|nr:hypothetical protein [Bryobacteraceae bacterium]